MSTVHSIDPETTGSASCFETTQAGLLIRIDTLRLLPGMFVAAFDRPWDDTPFPQSGLLIESDEQLAALRRHCQQVCVDPARSLKAMTDAIHAAGILSGSRELTLVDDDAREEPIDDATAHDGRQRSATSPTPPAKIASALRRAAHNAASLRASAPKRRDDVRPDRQAIERLRTVLRASDPTGNAAPAGPMKRMRRWLHLPTGNAVAALPTGSLSALRERYGTVIGAVEPAMPRPIREVLPQARAAHARLTGAIDRLHAQVRLGDIPAIDALDGPVGLFVDAVVKSPDAMRWIQAIYTQRTPTPNPAPAVALNLAILGRSLGMTPAMLHDLACAGLLLDIGKVLLPRNLLEHPGTLDAKNYALMQQHVTIGLELAQRAPSPSPLLLRAIAEHHERLDGSGYPHGLRGESIGLAGRMAAIVDSFHGLTAIRAYAHPLSVENALSALNQWSETLFCRDLVEHFARATGIYPVGTLVELTNGEVAAVVDQRPGTRPRPRLAVIANANKGPLRDTGDVNEPSGGRARDDVGRIRIARGLRTGAWGLRLPDHHD